MVCILTHWTLLRRHSYGHNHECALEYPGRSYSSDSTTNYEGNRPLCATTNDRANLEDRDGEQEDALDGE